MILAELEQQVPIKQNVEGSPSQWYMPLVGGEHFFDGFGFHLYSEKFAWPLTLLDQAEQLRGVKKPLIPFLALLNDRIPQKWDRHKNDYGPNEDWLLWALKKEAGGAAVRTREATCRGVEAAAGGRGNVARTLSGNRGAPAFHRDTASRAGRSRATGLDSQGPVHPPGRHHPWGYADRLPAREDQRPHV